MTDSEQDLYAAIAPHLPFLRRFARALTGTQASGDRFTAAALEAILADAGAFDPDLPPKIALFRTFCSVWIDTSGIEEPASLTEMERAAQERLSRLDPRARQAFLLGALEGFTSGEIAAIMSIPTAEAGLLRETGVEQMRAQTRSRVQIIEDEPIIAMDIREIVEGMGHECVGIADTCGDAVALYRETLPDLVLADIQLADGSSGVDAVREILAIRAVPSIFITAYPERLLTGERPEPAFLITKPFKRAAVEAAVSQALFFDSALAIEDLPG